MGGGVSEAAAAAAAWVWAADLPVRVDWAGAAAQCASLWAHARALLVVPAVRLLVALSLAMTVMVLAEKLFVCAVCVAVRALRLGPHRRYRWEPIAAAAVGYPVVLVQIPMYNEREVSE